MMRRQLERLVGIRCVVLDFDGTLVDSNAIKRRAFDDVLGPLGAGPEIVADTLARVSGTRSQVIGAVMEALDRSGRLTGDAAEMTAKAVDAYTRLCEETISRCPEKAGAAAALARLGARYALYVNSDTPEDTLRRIVERRGWTGAFRGVCGRPAEKLENLGRIAAQEGLSPDALAMVGDSRRDQEAAREFGCRFIGVRSDGNDFSSGVVVLARLSDLVE
jgi:phosphoglycolate phosphatase-like HAD superfamily hydrolase